MSSKDRQDTLVESSWDRIASAVRSDGPRDVETVHATLIELNPAWHSEAMSLVVELCGFAYGQVLDRARRIAAARRKRVPISEQTIDELRTADDVLDIVRALFERCEPEAVRFNPSLN
jgi:hypothetical protein